VAATVIGRPPSPEARADLTLDAALFLGILLLTGILLIWRF
jgi:hypothetical protein